MFSSQSSSRCKILPAAARKFFTAARMAANSGALFVSPVRDADGNIVQYFASLIDLTTYKEDEGRSRMPIDELNHRVKNTLSTVGLPTTTGIR